MRNKKPQTLLLNHMVELDTPWVSETIDEIFDGAPELLTENAVIYGGAIRDVVAGVDLLGDLDICVSETELSNLIKAFSDSTKWVRHDPFALKKSRNLIPISNKKNSLSNRPAYLGENPISFGLNNSNITDEYKYTPIANIITFYATGGHKVQLMQSKKNIMNELTGQFDLLESAIYPVRCADIRCCGLIMTKDGRVYEVVEGAYQDCLDKVLRIHTINASLNVNRLKERIKKLEERGWTSEIDLKTVGKKAAKAKAIEASKEKARSKKQHELMVKMYGKSDYTNLYETMKYDLRGIAISRSGKNKTSYNLTIPNKVVGHVGGLIALGEVLAIIEYSTDKKIILETANDNRAIYLITNIDGLSDAIQLKTRIINSIQERISKNLNIKPSKKKQKKRKDGVIVREDAVVQGSIKPRSKRLNKSPITSTQNDLKWASLYKSYDYDHIDTITIEPQTSDNDNPTEDTVLPEYSHADAVFATKVSVGVKAKERMSIQRSNEIIAEMAEEVEEHEAEAIARMIFNRPGQTDDNDNSFMISLPGTGQIKFKKSADGKLEVSSKNIKASKLKRIVEQVQKKLEEEGEIEVEEPIKAKQETVKGYPWT